MPVATNENVDVAYVDQGYNGANAAATAEANGIDLVVVKRPEAKKRFVLLPRRWATQPKVPRAIARGMAAEGVERSFAWTIRFRRLVKDYERYASTLAGLHLVAFVCLMSKRAAILATSS